MKREKMTFNVPPAVRTEIKNYVKLLGFKSESDLCNKAINEYLTYDNLGRLKQIQMLDGSEITDYVNYTYDGFGRVTQEQFIRLVKETKRLLKQAVSLQMMKI